MACDTITSYMIVGLGPIGLSVKTGAGGSPLSAFFLLSTQKNHILHLLFITCNCLHESNFLNNDTEFGEVGGGGGVVKVKTRVNTFSVSALTNTLFKHCAKC